ncbi:MAG: 3-alpha,7-alpha,12-alpha-trihydroxy-5-beta-cholest-24-enoyl-CoA hydratase [Alphaproteobacteria bacterium]|nr:3-alpha,7-alpha,12-alpha-trihydroxy-5-beta-cholest-24-enoyl-CoA hydratase [Alphaproteobacteria bacterium]
MAFTYDEITARTARGEYSYGDRETMLYALGLGMGREPLDPQELRYCYEKNLKTVPTMAALFSARGNLLEGVNYTMVVHGEQRVTLHQPLPWKADLLVESRVAQALDKGAGKGAVIYLETKTRLKDSGEPVSTSLSSIFARGDGGFGGPSGPAPAETHRIPDRAPDASCELATREDQALIYRLSGDRNPLHCDPDVATAAGFPRPILHGLCTYGVACRAVLQTLCDYDHTRIAGFDARFSSPVFPGETVITDMWVDGDVVSYRCRLKEREATVINNGRALLRS